ncbi:hypothetical protein EV368DRAFT_80083 [Lentinula lateritia]|nr:hypothetical protein EV368DRAFT_80083 [Lentinula lateritia]
MIISLPNEIQLEIFYALHSSDATQIVKQDTLHAVSHVCRRWRHLSTSTSIFWTYILVKKRSVDLSVHFDDPVLVEETHTSLIFPWVSTLLRRSGTKPIDVRITLQSNSFNPSWSEARNWSQFSWSPGHAVILSRILATHAARLRTVEILSDVWQPIQDLGAALVDVPMPLLQAWDVTRDYLHWSYPAHNDLELDATMPAIECPLRINPSTELNARMYPNLRILTLQGVPQNWDRLIPRNLVELDLKYVPLNRRPDPEALRALLLGSQFSLQSLTLWAAAPLRGDHVKITLPNLKTLSLGFSFLHTAINLTTYLEVPNLSSLEIYDMTNNEDSVLMTEDLYMHMIDHWPLKQLTQLTLRSPSFPESDYDDLEDAFAEYREVDSPLPILLNFLLQCSSVKKVHFIDPDIASLRALVTVSPVNHQGFPGQTLACSSLDLLQIETSPAQFVALDDEFSRHNESWFGVAPRAVDTILLDVLPGCEYKLRSFLSTYHLAGQVLNKRKRVFRDSFFF